MKNNENLEKTTVDVKEQDKKEKNSKQKDDKIAVSSSFFTTVFPTILILTNNYTPSVWFQILCMSVSAILFGLGFAKYLHLSISKKRAPWIVLSIFTGICSIFSLIILIFDIINLQYI